MSRQIGRALVTGADGFIGSHLVEALVRRGTNVRAFCMYNSQGSLGWLDTVPREIRSALDVQLGDVRDAGFVARASAGVDTVFHLAALIAIPYSYVAPESVLDTNVRGTMNMLEGARAAKVGRFVQTSTSEVYGTPDVVPIRETHPMQAQSPYAASKVAADQLALSYHASFGVPVTVLRPFNTYGPRQSSRAVLPAILTQLLAGKKEIELGRVDTKRDLTFVGDTVEGFLCAATADGLDGQTVHLGTGESITIADLFTLACRAVGVDATIKSTAERMRPDASEVLTLLSDPSRAATKLQWKARTSLEDGVRQTAEWLRAHLDAYSTERLHV